MSLLTDNIVVCSRWDFIQPLRFSSFTCLLLLLLLSLLSLLLLDIPVTMIAIVTVIMIIAAGNTVLNSLCEWWTDLQGCLLLEREHSCLNQRIFLAAVGQVLQF